MCWHYNKQELQLFNFQVVLLRLVHDIRLGFGRLAPSTAIARVGPPQSCELRGL